jgi:hypothetical protein
MRLVRISLQLFLFALFAVPAYGGEKVITLANEPVSLQFYAMERSLRATGCKLPLWVIPYDERKFQLPPNASWWEMPEVLDWLTEQKAHNWLRRYQCLTIANYLYLDCDICVLRNPQEALEPYEQFVAACTDWNKPECTYTDQSKSIMARRTSTWLKSIFNSGQFACDRALYTVDELKAVAGRPDYSATCLHDNDQRGLNLLVFHSGATVTNLTLPPVNMESTWAGDYPGEYQHLWDDPRRKPLLIHWAGGMLYLDRPINRIFYDYLTPSERNGWDEHIIARDKSLLRKYRQSLPVWKRPIHDLKQTIKKLYPMGRHAGQQRVGFDHEHPGQ